MLVRAISKESKSSKDLYCKYCLSFRIKMLVVFLSFLALFMAFDENLDNHIDFKEIACGISACCRGPQLERQKCKYEHF